MHRRPWIAAFLSIALIVWLKQGGETPAVAFSYGFPLLILSGSWLWRRLQSAEQHRGQGVWLLALLFLAPVVATRSWNEINAMDYMEYIAPIEHVFVAVIQARSVLTGVGEFLGFIALTMAILGGRRSLVLVGALVAASVVSVLMEYHLEAAAAALQNRDFDLAQHHARWTEWHGIVAIFLGAMFGLLGFLQTGGVWKIWDWVGHILALLVLAWVVRPSLPALLQLPDSVQEVELPQTVPGTSVPLTALDPWAQDFMEQATERGASPREKDWSCSGRDTKQWLAIPRLSVALAVGREQVLSELDSVLTALYAKSIHRIHLVGQATPKPGALNEALSNPTLPFLLAAPPIGSHWVVLDGDEVDWVFGGEPQDHDSICVVLPLDELTIGDFYHQGRKLLEESGCQALSLMPQPWRSRIQLPITSDPGCSKRGAWSATQTGR